MAAAAAPPLEEISVRATALTDHYQLTMETTEQELKEVTLDEFVSSKIGGLFVPLIPLYQHLFCSAGVTSRDALDALVRRHGNRETFAALEHLLDVEGEWDAFLLALDARLGSAGRQPPARLSAAPCQLELENATTGRRCRLDDWPGSRLLVLLRHFA